MTVDCISDLPDTKAGHTAIKVFVDRLGMRVHFDPCWNNTGAAEIVQIYIEETSGFMGFSSF